LLSRPVAATKIISMFRRAIERKRFKKLIASVPHIIKVSLLDAFGLKSGLFLTDPDVYIIANVVVGGLDKPLCLSASKSKIISGCSPAWNEVLRLTSSANDHVTLNLFSKGLLTVDTFLGQAVIDMSEHVSLFTRTSSQEDGNLRMLMLNLPFSAPVFPVYNSEGARINVALVGQGHIRLQLRVPSIHENVCGWFWNITSSYFGATSGDKVWVVLCDGFLFCYDNTFEITLLRKIDCRCIRTVENVVYDKLEIPLEGLKIKLTEEESLLWGWATDNTRVKEIWTTALRCVHHSTPKPVKTKVTVTKLKTDDEGWDF
jgi:hypothetical protein